MNQYTIKNDSEGAKFGNYLRYKNMNFSIQHKFNPLTLAKAIKIINYSLDTK